MNDVMGDAVEEHSCRICRGEATPEAPLFHPCNCRGSIKYIHQDCLEEWLKHSNKKDATCDICHEKYKFTTVYDENTPDRVPLHLLFAKLRSVAWNYGKYFLLVSELVFGCVFQIPLFWATTSRFFTWLLDGQTLHGTFALHMIYGDEALAGEAFDFWNISAAAMKAHLRSLLTMCIVALIVLVLFLEYEKVVRDPGFIRLVKRNIGEERMVRLGNRAPVANGEDWLQAVNGRNAPPARNNPANNQNNINQQERLDEALQNLERLQRLVNNVDGLDNEVVAEAVRRMLERHIELQREIGHPEAAPDNGLLLEEDEDEDPDFNPDDLNHGDDSGSDDLHSEEGLDDEDNNDNDDEDEDVAAFERFARFEEAVHGDANVNPRVLGNRAANIAAAILHDVDDIPAAEIPIPINHEHPGPRLEDQQLPMFGGMRPPVPAAAIAPIGRDNQPPVDPLDMEAEEFLATLHLETIIVISDVSIFAFLLLFYCVPTIIGTLIFQLVFYIGSLRYWIGSLLLKTFGLEQSNLISASIIHDTLSYYLPQTTRSFEENILQPLIEMFTRVYHQDLPLSNTERSIPLVICYGVALLAILGYLRIQESTHSVDKPLLGVQRKLYMFWFGVVSTLKVFLIFSLELVFFPTFCGLLLMFVVSPIVPEEYFSKAFASNSFEDFGKLKELFSVRI